MHRPRVLFIQHEIYKWQQAKMWSYNLHLAYEAGLRANGVDFFTLATPWVPRAREILNGRTFDQIWINDIAHSSKPGGLGGYKLTTADWEWIAGLAPVRLGFITETVEYTEEECAANALLRDTKRAIEATLHFVTHVAAIDEHDFPILRLIRDLPIFWLVPPMPEALISDTISALPKTKATFIGTPYGDRAKWLELPVLKKWLAQQISPDNLTSFPGMFDELHGALLAQLLDASFPIAGLYQHYIDALREIHYQTFTLYLDGLRQGSAVVHLPSYCKVYNCRVYEGMAAGRPVITSKGPDRPRLDRLFEDGRDILLYPVDDPETLSRHIQHILQDPEFGLQIAVNARDKLLRFHTMEKRVAQLLTWIEKGEEPCYGGARGDATPCKADGSAKNGVSFIPDTAAATAAVAPAVALRQDARRGPSAVARPRPKNKLRILLVSPPYARLLSLGNCRFPLSFGNMATILSMNGHEVGIYDADFDKDFIGKSDTYEYTFSSQDKIRAALQNRGHYVWKEIERTICGFNPDVVGITTMTSKYPMALRIAEMAKFINRDITVVAGGHHASIFGPKMVENPSIDFAIIGEGEMTFLELINRLCDPRPDFSRVNGLTYKDGERTVTNNPRELLCNLDVLPVADRDLMINEGYVSENNIMASRGCPFNCSYCGAQVIWKRKVRRRSVPAIIREIDYLLKRGPSRTINFWDDTFTGDRRYVSELMLALKKYDGLRFSCITRLDVIDRQTLAHLKDAGCNHILFGIESGSDEILRRIDKRMTREMIRQKTALVHAAGIPWLGFFIMGYPGETREDMLKTLAFMKELDPSYAEINIFNPLPGTQIWNELETNGLVGSDLDFSRYSQSSTENFFSNGHMTKQEFKELALYMAREFDAHNRRNNG